MFEVVTNHPIANWSRDHREPHGVAVDNSRNLKFNHKLYKLFPHDKKLFVMDLGCAGGGFMKDCIDDGHTGIGLEGSDYCREFGTGEWPTIPTNLFTCDITNPFQVKYNNQDVVCDVITAWEVMEHIPQDRLHQLLQNIYNHLKKGGIFVCSVSPNEEYWHVTVHDRDWWQELFRRYEFILREDIVAYFDEDWIRGPKQNAPNSFHFVLQHN